jgi:hypothetical protein
VATVRRTLASLLQQAYPSPEFALFFEVQDPGSGRRADAIALGIWPSRGYSLTGFEFKEYRHDWMREKKNPAKADRIATKCDAWFVVAGADDIVDLEELPEPWGLLVASPNREKLLTRKKAAPYADRDRSVISRDFVAAMLRKVSENTVPKATLPELIETGVQQELARTLEGNALRRAQEHIAKLEAERENFRKVTGVDIHGWRGGDIAKAVAAILEGDSHRRHLERTRDQLVAAAKDVSKAIASWPTATPIEAATGAEETRTPC